MKIAIYSRKSKFTGKGESIENQIELCKEHAYKNYKNIEDFIIYEDEGFSGGNIDRPQFKKMIRDVKSKKIDVVICYRLDRVSRNVSDFSSTLDLLQEYDVDFVSVREQFDTSTPMGRAMIYIASVFAQLERETIAERIKDNMYQLARSGRWLGGRTPFGFKSKEIEYYDSEMNIKKMYKLTPDEKNLNIVKVLFDQYLNLGSLTRLESWTIENNYKNKKGNFFEITTLKTILTNPVYCKADELSYKYFEKLDSDITDSKYFDGKHGLMVFNKNEVKKHTVNRKDESEWIVAVGKHKGVIESSQWIQVQNMIQSNSHKAPRKGTGTLGLLSGLIKCGKCGSTMGVRRREKDKNGLVRHYYKCRMKEKSRSTQCNNSNLIGIDIDNLVIDKIKELAVDDSALMKTLEKHKGNISKSITSGTDESKAIAAEIKEYEDNIRNLTLELAKNKESVVAKYIIEQIENLDSKIRDLKNQVAEIEESSEEDILRQHNIEIMKELLLNFNKNIDKLDFQEKKALLNRIVKQVTWDGENLKIDIYGQNL